MIDQRYSNRKAKEHKDMRLAYSKLTEKEDRYKFMIKAEAYAIYLTHLEDDSQSAWHPMLGGYIMQNGATKYPCATWQEAIALAEKAREEYRNKLQLIHE